MKGSPRAPLHYGRAMAGFVSTTLLGAVGAVVAGTVLRAYLRGLIARRNAELTAALKG